MPAHLLLLLLLPLCRLVGAGRRLQHLHHNILLLLHSLQRGT